MNNKYNVVLLFGPPGSGKGTWGKILGMMPGFFHVSTGDMFRMLNVESKLGLRVMEIIRKGELVPDDITFNMWQEHVKNAVFVGSFRPQKDVLVLDGLPRTKPQAEMLQSVAAVRAILKLDCEDHEILIERLHRRAVLEGRGDDANEAIIRHRFEIYNRQIQQTLAFYPRDMMAYIDVTIPPVRILAAIGNVLSKSLTSMS
ncbi:nucleoside monophosphate kinase [candidate division KSB1 bacterium]|nr:nucleoside monophosphate kinase [candidate division KSB1 bacterium]